MERLFVYGTLQDHSVQNSLIGRTLDGIADSLGGYAINPLLMPPYPVAVPKTGEKIMGMVLEVTSDELDKLDTYEGECYLRVEIWLTSGQQAWVYVVNPACYPEEDFDE